MSPVTDQVVNFLRIRKTAAYQVRKFASDSIVLSPRDKPKGLRSSDLIDPSGAAAFGADWMSVDNFGSARAGRAEAMASAMGQEVPYVIRAPRRHQLLPAVGGTLGGAVVGSAVGALVAKLNGETGNRAAASIAMGGNIGGYSGMAAGAIWSTIQKRKEMKRITSDFDNFEGKITPTARKGHVLGFSASHARGREEAFRAMLGGDRKMRGSVTENISRFIPYGTIATLPISPFLVNDSNNNMSEIARRDGAYGFQGNMEKF